jgi:hypothetical protein
MAVGEHAIANSLRPIHGNHKGQIQH